MSGINMDGLPGSPGCTRPARSTGTGIGDPCTALGALSWFSWVVTSTKEGCSPQPPSLSQTPVVTPWDFP